MNLGVPSEHSIFVERAAAFSGVHTTIKNNRITLPHGLTTLPNDKIRLIEVRAPFGAFDQAVIADNKLRCDYGNPVNGANTRTIYGIWIEDEADGYSLSGDSIDYTNPNKPNVGVESFGIRFNTFDGLNNFIGPDNYIISNLFSDPSDQFKRAWLRCGIHVTDSKYAQIRENHVVNTRHDYHWSADCSNGEFGRNLIGGAYQGLAISGQFPNNHNYRANVWDPSSSWIDYDARWIVAPPLMLN